MLSDKGLRPDDFWWDSTDLSVFEAIIPVSRSISHLAQEAVTSKGASVFSPLDASVSGQGRDFH